MVWKQDLAKLKHQLAEPGEPPRPAQPPKPAAPLGPPKSLGEEDAMFLAAMGRRAAEESPVSATREVGYRSAPLQVTDDADFQEALGELTGLKALGGNPVLAKPIPPAPTVDNTIAVPPPPPAPRPLPPVQVEAVVPRTPPGPKLIHLAAGMAVEVDGVLDLSGHTVSDAKERLKERLQDAGVLGWRTLHLNLGPSEALRQAFLAFLLTPPARGLAQYAQAPIPMGGSQAFILYFAAPKEPQ